MADEVEMTPVTGVEPPKVKPTLKMPPIVKPGLKLPTQAALKPGLKLPHKPGAALKPGLKLPTQTALKPGLKLPPKPVIRKPGAAPTAAPLPKPIGVDAQGVGKLPTVSSAPASHAAAAEPVALPKPMEALKTVTQKLKGITQEIPQQAILHKTGIIAEGDAMSDAQKEAAKHKTARISLSDAMGAAPVKNEAAPMKTIRIKRPINIPSPTSSLTPQPPAQAATPAAPAVTPTAEKPAEPAPTLTQRKTLKISRPGAKLTAKQSAPVVPAAAPAAEPAVAEEGGEVADIPDISSMPNAPVPMAAPTSDETGWAWTLSVLVQFAACVVLGALAWFLYQNTQTAYF